jgi:hypothetical protein
LVTDPIAAREAEGAAADRRKTGCFELSIVPMEEAGYTVQAYRCIFGEMEIMRFPTSKFER